MFYEPDKRNHGLRYNPFKALVVPRPIGWISSVDTDGIPNLAPYSMFNAVADDPPCVMFASSTKIGGAPKDSKHCAEATGEFVVNLATYNSREPMNRSSEPLPLGTSEFDTTQLEFEPSVLVKAPRVRCSPVQLECKFLQSIEMPSGQTHEISIAGPSLMNDDVPSRWRGEDHVHRKPGSASRCC